MPLTVVHRDELTDCWGCLGQRSVYSFCCDTCWAAYERDSRLRKPHLSGWLEERREGKLFNIHQMIKHIEGYG